MGTLWGYSEGEGHDYEIRSGRGKYKKVQGRRGGWDYTQERNFGSGGGSGCAWIVLAGLAAILGGGAVVLEQVSQFLS